MNNLRITHRVYSTVLSLKGKKRKRKSFFEYNFPLVFSFIWSMTIKKTLNNKILIFYDFFFRVHYRISDNRRKFSRLFSVFLANFPPCNLRLRFFSSFLLLLRYHLIICRVCGKREGQSDTYYSYYLRIWFVVTLWNEDVNNFYVSVDNFYGHVADLMNFLNFCRWDWKDLLNCWGFALKFKVVWFNFNFFFHKDWVILILTFSGRHLSVKSKTSSGWAPI